MKTAIGYQTYYTLIVKKQSITSGNLSPLHLHRGCYTDIRDVMQTIVNFSKRYANIELIFLLEQTDRKPIGWIHRSRYYDQE